jgi:UDP-N-acetylglucosamine/UDP-N-acetylgalactosamine diphosphorylase
MDLRRFMKTPIQRERLEQQLAPFGQSHLLNHWDQLNESQRARLANQIAAIDLPLMRKLYETIELTEDFAALAERAAPPTAFRLSGRGERFTREQAHRAAGTALREGKLGAILVAGGQGTRLGFPHPKGMFAIGPISGRTLFEMHVEQLLAVATRYGVRIPLYLMTSPSTHDETVSFFESHDRFGLPSDDLHIFCQGTMPALDDAGRLLLEAPDTVFVSPDGHGGMLAALKRSGGLEDARRRGLEQFFYFQVDNPLVDICDRDLLGFHRLTGAEMSTQVVAKTTPHDKLGNVVSIDGKLHVIEYSDLPDHVARRRDQDGQLLLWAGSIAVHVLNREFLERAAEMDAALPLHRAHKIVPYVDDHGKLVTPKEANATKFERFIFDLMPFAETAIVVESDERCVFAPVKNATGADKDTPEMTRSALVAKFVRWLESAGASVAPGVQVEIHPAFALDAEQLRERLTGPLQITQDAYLCGQIAHPVPPPE